VSPDYGIVNVTTTGASGGFMKGVVTYNVMDDLTVMLMSTISNIIMLNKFKFLNMVSLECVP